MITKTDQLGYKPRGKRNMHKYQKIKLALKDEPCRFCGSPNVTPSHQTARSQGGDDTIDNIFPECLDCHSYVHHGILTPRAKKLKELGFYG